jgi:hypothetical protein
MLVQEIIKIYRRRGMFWSFVGVSLAVAILVLGISLIVTATSDDLNADVSGAGLLEATSGVLALVCTVLAALMGAQEGAYDTAHGTFRYLAMTGRSKLALYAVRFPAFVVVALVALLPALIVMSLGVAAIPIEPLDESAGLSDHAAGVWRPVLSTVVYGCIALGVGALLRSVGGAIAVAIALSVAGVWLVALLILISEELERAVLPIALGVLTGDADGFGVVAAAICVAVWVGGFVAGGALRTLRSEY